MKITSVDVLQLRNQAPQLDVGGGVHHPIKLGSTLVRIHTDEGITGLGESIIPHAADDMLVDHIKTQLLRSLIGEDPLNSEALWQRMWGGLYRLNGFARGISAVDQALWDIKGKKAGLPLYSLLGGKAQEALVAYATAPMLRPDVDTLVTDVERLQSYGFRIAKLVIGHGRAGDIDMIQEVHQRVAGKIELSMDANGGYDLPDAIAVGKAAAPLGMLWFEEPLPWYDIHGLSELTRRIDVPTAGFQEEATIWRLREYLEHDALAAYNVSVEIAGGVTVSQKMSAIIQAWGKRFIPHGFGPPIAFAAMLHVAIAYPNCGPIEFPVPDRSVDDPRQWITAAHVANRGELAVDEGGFVRPPDRPGLGVELDEEALEDLVVR